MSHHHGVGKLRKPFIEDGTLWDDTAKKAVRILIFPPDSPNKLFFKKKRNKTTQRQQTNAK